MPSLQWSRKLILPRENVTPTCIIIFHATWHIQRCFNSGPWFCPWQSSNRLMIEKVWVSYLTRWGGKQCFKAAAKSWRINYPPTAVCGHYERELEGASWQPSRVLGGNGPKYFTNVVWKISLRGSKPGNGFTFKLWYMITRNSWSLIYKYSCCCWLNHASYFGLCSRIVRIRV